MNIYIYTDIPKNSAGFIIGISGIYIYIHVCVCACIYTIMLHGRVI